MCHEKLEGKQVGGKHESARKTKQNHKKQRAVGGAQPEKK